MKPNIQCPNCSYEQKISILNHGEPWGLPADGVEYPKGIRISVEDYKHAAECVNSFGEIKKENSKLSDQNEKMRDCLKLYLEWHFMVSSSNSNESTEKFMERVNILTKARKMAESLV